MTRVGNNFVPQFFILRIYNINNIINTKDKKLWVKKFFLRIELTSLEVKACGLATSLPPKPHLFSIHLKLLTRNVFRSIYLFVLRYTEVKANDGEKHPCFDIVQEVGVL